MKRFSLVNYGWLNGYDCTLAIYNFRFHTYLFTRFITLKKFFTILFVLFCSYAVAQTGTAGQQQADYRKVVTERVKKIVNTLGITDSINYYKVVEVMVNQYTDVNAIHEKSATTIAGIKAKQLSKEETDAAIKAETENKNTGLLQQHTLFISHLNESLTADQVEKVKNGMTYNVFPITYAAYQDMIPRLTTEQKQKIYDWLKEARELAMDAESSDAKHAVFGKYKGRINNYLSAQGYDSKKEREDWEARIKAKKETAKSSN